MVANLAPVKNGGKHPIIYRISTMQGGAGFRNHRWDSAISHLELW
jgi:hypothetical protein